MRSQPQDESAHTSGCGEAHIPWSSGLQDMRNTLTAGAGDWAPDRMLADCTFFGPAELAGQDERPGQSPAAQARCSLATIRRKLGHLGGTLTIHGSKTWRSDDRQDVAQLLNYPAAVYGPVDAVETATWRYILVRTSGVYSQ